MTTEVNPSEIVEVLLASSSDGARNVMSSELKVVPGRKVVLDAL